MVPRPSGPRSSPRAVRRGVTAVIAVLAAAIAPQPAMAQLVTWTGTGADASWGTAQNWSSLPGATGSGLVFSGTRQTSSVNNLVTSATSISFANTGATGSTGQFTLSGSSLTLAGNIATTAATTGTLTDTIALELILDGGRTITPNSNHNLVISGVISQTGGVRGLTKAGAGILTLSGSNTFGGQLGINNGTVVVSTIGAAGAASNTGTNGVIRLGNAGNTAVLTYTGTGESTNKQLQVGAGTTAGDFGTSVLNANGSGNLAFTNATFNVQQTGVIATAARVLELSGTSATTNEIQGVIQNNAGTASGTAVALTKTGAATWVLSGNNTYTGPTTVSSGTLVLNRSGGAVVDTGAVSVGDGTLRLAFDETIASLTVTGMGAVTGPGALTATSFAASTASGTSLISANLAGSGGLTKTGAGALVLSGSTSYAGVTTVTSGALVLNRSGGAIVDTGTVSVGNGTLQLAFDETIASLTVTGTGAVTGPGTLTAAAFSASTATGTSLVSANLAGAGGLSKTGAGTLTLTGSNLYAGATTVTGGTLRLTRPQAIYGGTAAQWTQANLVTGSGATLALAVGGAGEFTSGDVQLIAAAGFAAGATLGLDTGNAPAAGFTLAGAVGDAAGGTVPLTVAKLGGSRLVLSASNAFSGGFVLGNTTANTSSDTTATAGSGGFVVVGDSAALGGGTVRAIGAQLQAAVPGLVIGNPFVVESGALRFGGAQALTLAGTITLSGGNRSVGNYAPMATLTLNAVNLAGNNLTFEGDSGTGVGDVRVTGPISGTGSVQTFGNFTGRALVLSGSSTFTRGVIIDGGTVRLAADSTGVANAVVSGPLGTGTLTLSGGTLTGEGSVTPRTVLNPVIINAASTVGDAANNAALTFAGSFTNSGGNRTLTNALAGSGNLTLSGSVFLSNDATGRTLTISGSGTTVITGVVANSGTAGGAAGGLTLDAAGGSLRLTGANTYTGTTTVTSGTLVIDRDGGAIPDASPVSLGAGTLQLSFSDTVGSLAVTGNGTVTGPGSLTLSTGTLAVASAATTVTISTGLAGSAGLTKTGTGTAVLTGSNAYTGPSRVTSGTLVLGQRQALYGGDAASWTTANLAVSSGAAVVLDAGGPGEFDGIDVATIASLGSATEGFLAGSALGIDTVAGGTVAVPAFGSPTGGVTIVKLGAGTLVLGGSNSHTGGTRLGAGGLVLGDGGALGSGPFTIAGGTLSTSVSGGFVPAVAVSSTVTGPFTFAGAESLSLGSGTTTLTGGWTVTLADSGALTIPNLGIATGAGFNWNITPAEGSSGRVSIGTVALNTTTDTANRTRNFIVNGGTTSIAGPVSDGNAFANTLQKSGVGTLQLGGTNSYTGSTTVSAGRLVVTNTAAIPAGRAVTVAAGTLDLQADATVGALALTDIGSITGSSLLSGTSFSVSNASGTATVSAPLAGSGLLTKSGAGTVLLEAASTFTGGVTLDAGVVRLGIAAVGTPAAITSGPLGRGTLTLSGGTLAGSDSSTPRTVLNPTVIEATATIGDGVNNAAITFAGSVTNNGGNRTLTNALAGSGTLTLAGPVYLSGGQSPRTFTLAGTGITLVSGTVADAASGSGAAGSGLTKSGAGTVILAAANTHTGTTTVSAGTLRYDNVGAFGAGRVSVTGAATLRAGVSGTVPNAVAVSSGVAATFDTQSFTSRLSGTVSGAGGVTKTGAGTLQLAAANTVSGPIVVNSGTLALPGSSSGTGTVTVNAGGTLDLREGTGLYKTGAFFNASGTTAVRINAGGTLIVDKFAYGDNNNFNQLRSNYYAIAVNGGTIQFSGTNSTPRAFLVGAGGATIETLSGAVYTKTSGSTSGQNVIRFDADSTLTFMGAGDATIADSLAPAGYGNSGFSIAKTGAGVLRLTGSNLYTGSTSLSAGVLEIGPTGSVNSSAGILVNGSTAWLAYNSAAPLTAPLTLGQGTLSGTGAIGVPVVINAGVIHAPGNSPGIQSVLAETWGRGGTYTWEFNALEGSAGSNWDQIAVQNLLDLSGLSVDNRFILDLVTLTAGDVAGPLDVPYVAGSSHRFTIATFGSLAVPVGFSTAPGSDLTGLFALPLNGWQGPRPGASEIRVEVNSASGIDILVVPEPGAAALAGLGIAVAALTCRRRAPRQPAPHSAG